MGKRRRNMDNAHVFGAILVRLDTKRSRGKEKEFKDFIFAIIEGKTKTKRHKACINPKKRSIHQPRFCDSLNIIAFATLLGYFDYIIGVETTDIPTLENFVLHCLRNSDVKNLVAETQTLAGTQFFPRKDNVHYLLKNYGLPKIPKP
jgi:hypothetical protein